MITITPPPLEQMARSTPQAEPRLPTISLALPQTGISLPAIRPTFTPPRMDLHVARREIQTQLERIELVYKKQIKVRNAVFKR